MKRLALSLLPHTWIIDLDGTVLRHNGYKLGSDELLPGVERFLDSIPPSDFIIFISAREEEFKEQTVDFLDKCNIRYDTVIFGVPSGERILINDIKPSGLLTAHAINVIRDSGLGELAISIADDL